MSPIDYQAILFDLDGTLCDTALDFTLALNRLLAEEQRPTLSLSNIRSQVSNGAMAIIKNAFSDIDDENRLTELKEQLIAYYQEHIVWHTQLYPGLEKLLLQLQEKQVPWGIVSNKPEALTIEIVRLLKLDYAPQAIIGGDTLSVAKPHPDPLILAANLCRVAPESCVYIGDHHRDIIAAKAAGMISIAASFGYLAPNESAHDWGADWVVDSPFQLLSLLNLSR